jgi:deoxyribodipyrimidine photo-lyase
LNNEDDFKRVFRNYWISMVDAGMRQLETGYMHNRVRMVVASFVNIY